MIRFLEQAVQNESHLAEAIVFLHNRLVLIHNEGNALKQSGQGGDVVQRRRRYRSERVARTRRGER